MSGQTTYFSKSTKLQWAELTSAVTASESPSEVLRTGHFELTIHEAKHSTSFYI